MQTNVQATSLRVYFNKVYPELGEKQREVLRVFRENLTMTFTNMELADELGWSINRVTPRVFELRGKGKNNPHKDRPLIIESERRICRVTKNKAIAWQLYPRGGIRIC